MGSLVIHQQTQYCKASGGSWKWDTMAPGRDPQTYRIDFPIMRGDEELSSQGVQGKIGYVEGNEVTLPPLTWQVHHDHTVVRQHYPPVVTLVQYYGSL